MSAQKFVVCFVVWFVEFCDAILASTLSFEQGVLMEYSTLFFSPNGVFGSFGRYWYLLGKER